MNGLIQCGICRSIVTKDRIDGFCKSCKRPTCTNCARVCDRCQEICCMYHMETKIVMRQQKPNLHKLCLNCREVW